MSSKQQPASLYQGKNLTAVVLALAWPTIVEQIFQTVVQYVDSAMVGRIGANASAAVGVTSTAMWLMNSFSFAVGVGFLACISRAAGAGPHHLRPGGSGLPGRRNHYRERRGIGQRVSPPVAGGGGGNLRPG